jgi:hypothetical protein
MLIILKEVNTMLPYTHKIGAIKFYTGNNCQSKIMTFTSDGALYCDAVLSIINHNPDYHDRLLFEPVTRSPVTFDLTVKYKSHTGNTYNSDRYFLTFTELKAFCDSLANDNSFVSVVKQPFCRVLFSQAGLLGDFCTRHVKGYQQSETPYKGDDSLFCNKPFSEFSNYTFSDIQNGKFNHTIEV